MYFAKKITSFFGKAQGLLLKQKCGQFLNFKQSEMDDGCRGVQVCNYFFAKHWELLTLIPVSLELPEVYAGCKFFSFTNILHLSCAAETVFIEILPLTL